MILQYYTFYLENGQRKVFLGIDPQDAYINNQSPIDSQQVIILVEQGVTDNYYWKDNSWVKKTTYQYTLQQQLTPELLQNSKAIVYWISESENIRISYEWTNDGLYCCYTKIIVLRYIDDNAYDDWIPEEDFYSKIYCTHAVNHALNVFIQSCNACRLVHPNNDEFHRYFLTSIIDEDSYDDIFGMLTKQQLLWMLGSLLKRVDVNKYIKHYVTEPYKIISIFTYDLLSRPDQYNLSKLESLIDYSINKVLLPNGIRDLSAEMFLKQYFQLTIEEWCIDTEENFLRMRIILQSGNYTYTDNNAIMLELNKQRR